MIKKAEILLTGKKSKEAGAIESFLHDQPWFDIASEFGDVEASLSRLKHSDRKTPDIVVIFLGENWQDELKAAADANNGNFDLIVMGPPDNAQIMRQAMKIGARDYMSRKVSHEELVETLREISRNRSNLKSVISVLNSKGGSGASFVAANLAHIMAARDKLNVALFDFDYQFGNQALNFNLEIEKGLSELLADVRSIDAVALKGYMVKHASGLYLLGDKLDPVTLPQDIRIDALDRVTDLLAQAFDQVIIDLPRQIDQLFLSVVSRSNRVILVMQQTLPHIMDTKRLLNILRYEFDVPREKITVLLNRYNEKSTLSIEKIEEAIGHSPLVLIPNDYKRVATVMDTATPLYEYAPTAPLTKALGALAFQLAGGEEDKSKPFFKRAFPSLFGG